MEEEVRDYDRRPLLAAAVVVLLLAAAGSIDYARTADMVPEPPAVCEPFTQACEDERNEAFEARLDRANELESDLEVRAWAYGAAAFLAVLAGAALTLRRNAPERRREVFTDLGVGAVLWLIGGFAISVWPPRTCSTRRPSPSSIPRSGWR